MVSSATYDYRSPAVIAPCIGVVLSMTRSVIPVREVLAARKDRRLGVSFDAGGGSATTLSASLVTVMLLRSGYRQSLEGVVREQRTGKTPVAASWTYSVSGAQELNPGPFAAMILNHTGWIVYAVLHTGMLLQFSNYDAAYRLHISAADGTQMLHRLVHICDGCFWSTVWDLADSVAVSLSKSQGEPALAWSCSCT